MFGYQVYGKSTELKNNEGPVVWWVGKKAMESSGCLFCFVIFNLSLHDLSLDSHLDFLRVDKKNKEPNAWLEQIYFDLKLLNS